MKTLIAFLFLFGFTSSTCQGQWVSRSFFGNQDISAFGVCDTSLFAYVKGGDVYRYNGVKSEYYWNKADKGILPGEPDKQVTSFAFIGSNFYSADKGGTIYRSIDNGGNWNGVHIPTSSYVGSLAVIDTVLLAGGDGIYRSTDLGTNWVRTSDDKVSFIAITASRIYAGGVGGIFSSTDTGLHWINVSSEVGPLIACAGNSLFAGSISSGVFRSTDSGKDWTDLTANGGPITITCLTGVGSNLFVGTQSGVYLTTDLGDSWQSVDTGLPNLIVTAMTAFDTNLFVGITEPDHVSSDGVFMRPLSQMVQKSAVQSVSQPPADTIEVFPNPATGLVTICSGAAIEQVSVINLLGETVLDIANRYSPTLDLDISKLSSGTYFVLVKRANSEVRTLKLVKE